MIKNRRIAAIVLAALTALTLTALTLTALTLAGCSSGPPPHNAADVTFVQGMIPHHAQAVTMSEQAEQKAASAEVKDLARTIAAAQGPEIDQMNGMLTAWGAPPAGGMPGMDHGAMPGTDHGAMTGMMTDAQMGRLAGLSGPAFDRAFLEMMTAHHEGAVEMSRTELAQGQNPQARQLARDVVDAQQAEIATMRGLLGRG